MAQRKVRSTHRGSSLFSSPLEPLERRILLSADIVVNTAAVHQTITGLGGNYAKAIWSTTEANDAQGAFNTQQLNPKVVRVGIPLALWEPANSNGDPSQINWSAFQDTGVVHDVFTMMQQFAQAGDTIIATVWTAPDWMVTPITRPPPLGGASETIPSSLFPQAANAITAFLVRAKQTYGVNVADVSINEANGGFPIFFTSQQEASFIETAGPMFVGQNLQTKFLVGDTYSPDTLVAFATPILNDVAAQPYLGPIAYHTWWVENSPDSVFAPIAALAQQYNKPLWATELGYDATIGNNQAQFATWDNAIRLATTYDRNLVLAGANVALLWDYQGYTGTNNDYPLEAPDLTPYPAFYVVQQLTQNLPPGSQIISVSSDNANLMTMAAKNPATGDVMVQVINTGTTALTVSVGGLTNHTYNLIENSATQESALAGNYFPSGGQVTVTFPADSVSMLTTLNAPVAPPEAPYGGIAASVPGVIQVENYDTGGEGVAYHDTDAANLGGAYRPSDGPDLEATTDTGGGYDLGWTKPGEWLKYTVSVTASGSYDFSARVASAGQAGTFHIEVDGSNVTGSMTIPNTGGWQTWQTVTVHGINLTAGTHVLKLALDTAGTTGFVGNFNYLSISPTSVTPPPATHGTPFGGSPASVPGVIQAENFNVGGEGVAYHSANAVNPGGAFRPTEGVGIEATGDTGGGYDVGWTHAGDWLYYSITVAAAGTYDFSIRVACAAQGGTFHVEIDSSNVTGSLTIPNTGGWQNYQTVTVHGIALTAGTHVLKLALDTAGTTGFVGNFNYLSITPSGATAPPPIGTPFGGSPAAAPGTIQAENFDLGGEGIAYHDTDAANLGGAYRPSDAVDLEATSDTGGGYDVGWTHATEWLDYTITVAATGLYTLDSRVASSGVGGTFNVTFDGVDQTGPMTIPNTGGWQSWQDVLHNGISLTAGTHVMRVVMDTSGASGFTGNFNYFKLTAAGS